MEEKRKKLITMILNSDEKGVDAIYKKLYENKKTKTSGISKEDLIRVTGEISAEMAAEVPSRILIFDEFAEFSVRLVIKLFEEEK